MRPGRYTAVLLLALLPLLAQAKELYGPDAGVIPFGMGRAYSAVADDWLSLYYNPAGLALVKSVDVQLFDLKVGSNQDVVHSYSNLKDLSDSSSGLANVLNKFAGKHILGQAGNITQITVPDFAFGIDYDVRAEADMENLAYPQTQAQYTKDLSFIFGSGVAVGRRKALRLGMSLAMVHRQGGAQEIGIDDISGNKNSVLDQFQSSGSGVAGTFGLQYRLPTPGRTEVNTSFVWHDIGDTSFGGAMSQDRPTRIDQNMVAGIAVRFPIGGRRNRRMVRRYGPGRSTNHLTFAFDYSHLNYGLGTEQFPKHLHLGMNLDLPVLSFQVGLNQSSLTLGTGFDIGIIRVEAATYGEELGSYAGQRRDRRYLLSIGSALGFQGF